MPLNNRGTGCWVSDCRGESTASLGQISQTSLAFAPCCRIFAGPLSAIQSLDSLERRLLLHCKPNASRSLWIETWVSFCGEPNGGTKKKRGMQKSVLGSVLRTPATSSGKLTFISNMRPIARVIRPPKAGSACLFSSGAQLGPFTSSKFSRSSLQAVVLALLGLFLGFRGTPTRSSCELRRSAGEQ